MKANEPWIGALITDECLPDQLTAAALRAPALE
jgi:hypothetical protein